MGEHNLRSMSVQNIHSELGIRMSEKFTSSEVWASSLISGCQLIILILPVLWEEVKRPQDLEN